MPAQPVAPAPAVEARREYLEDEIPEVDEADADDDELLAKRARVRGNTGDSDSIDQAGRSAGEEDELGVEPQSKRARTGTLSALKVSWADITEDDIDAGVEACFTLRCDHCDEVFGSRNHLFSHLREVRKLEADSLLALGFLRSTADGRARTDEIARGGDKHEHPMRDPHFETSARDSKNRKGSRYDVCEVFSPARVAEAARRQGLRGGWSLDLSQRCTVTGRTWNCLVEADRAWAKRMLYRDKPELLVVCPPCTLFCRLQHLSPNGLPEERCPGKYAEAVLMLNFAAEI